MKTVEYCTGKTTLGSISSGSRYDVGGRMLRMVTLDLEPFVIRHRNETSTWYTGLCIDLLHILADTLNFTYSITEPADKIWGLQLPNGTWAGMTGMLYRKEADFALTGMSVSHDRATVSDYTIPFYYDEMVLITTRPDIQKSSSKFYLQPFNWMVYLLLGCCFVMVTGVWVWLKRHHRKAVSENKKHHTCSLQTENRRSLWSIGKDIVEAQENLFGSLLGRAVTYKDVSVSRKTLLCAWLWLSVVMVATYTGKLTSSSVTGMEDLPFNSLSELVKRTDYRWGQIKGGRMENIFSTSTDKDYQQYYQKVLEFAEDDPDIRSWDMKNKILPRLLDGQFVFMAAISNYKLFKHDYCQLTVAEERLFTDFLAIHLQKGSPYTNMFSSVITTAREMGLLEILTRKWFPEPYGCRGDQTTAITLTLELVQTPFVMAACGLLLSTLLLSLEYLMKQYSVLT